MRYINNTTEFQLNHTAVCLGKFDGVHIGHQKLIEQTIFYKTKGYQAVAFSFSLHPSSLFSQKEVELLDTEEEKYEKLKDAGIDVFLSYPFTKETASIEPEAFVKDILVKQLGVKVIVVGDDFCFGHKRKGNVDLLERLSYEFGYHLIVVNKVELEGAVVSSSRIRDLLSVGNMELANNLLGKPYMMENYVVHGQKYGRTIGIPTINQIPKMEKLLPPNGVYVSTTWIDNKQYGGITNIGYKPTVEHEHMKGIETNIFGYEGNLYGKKLKVYLHSYVRKEEKFASLDELRNQILKDIDYSKNYLSQRKICC